jgi:FAD/FMN-containing dehydrogenase
VLIELASQAEHGLRETAESLLSEALAEASAEDAALASSLDQRKAFWRLREDISEVQKQEGGSIKHDVSVPVASVPVFIDAATRAVENALPDARVVAFGHVGDGNIHFNVSQPVGADKTAFLARWQEINAVVHEIVASFGGSISAEHGIGRLKRDLLPNVKDPVALDVMRALKRTLDPKGLLNQGKVL